MVPTMPDGDSPTACPICRQVCAAGSHDDHLRTVHGLVRYRGVHRGLDDTLDAIRDDLICAEPSDAAWQALVRLAREVKGDAADAYLARRLASWLAKADRAVHGALVTLLVPGSIPLFLALARSERTAGRLLALAGLAGQPLPHPQPIRRVLRTLVRDRSLPLDQRLDAVARVLPGLGTSPQARKLLQALLAGHGKARSLDRLRRLSQRTGPLPVLDRFEQHLQERLRMSCPRCGSELRGEAMLTHLWDQHRLVLDGTRVREPWNVLEEWLDRARQHGEPEWIARARIAADKIDPQGGARRLVRLLLQRGMADDEVRQAVLAEAREHHASCCPWCYARVPLPRPAPGAVLIHRGGRLVGGGYALTLDEQGLRPWLEVITPVGVLYRGVEPDGGWTPRGAAFLWGGTIILLAVVCALIWPAAFGSPLRPVVVLLFAAYLVHLGFRLYARQIDGIQERVLEHAWTWLAPRLHASGFDPGDSAFLTGLARLYSREGRTDAPEEELARYVQLTEAAVEQGKAPAAHLAALVRLQIEQQADDEDDPVPLVVRWLTRCLTGKLPVQLAQELLEDWAAEWWTPVNLARLRILVCDRAFEAGFEVENLIDLGQTAPALGTILRLEAPRRLAALRLVWSLRANRPWDRLGEVVTAFELASSSERSGPLSERPDLLLRGEDRRFPLSVDGGSPRPATVQVTLAGVWVQDLLFIIPPRQVEVRPRSGSCEMILGRDAFRSAVELDNLARQLERWFRWVFHDLLPRVDGVLEWRSPHRGAILRAWGAITCPECRQFLLPRVGEVGLAVGEAVVVEDKE